MWGSHPRAGTWSCTTDKCSEEKPDNSEFRNQKPECRRRNGVLPQRHKDTKRTPDRAEFRNQRSERRSRNGVLPLRHKDTKRKGLTSFALCHFESRRPRRIREISPERASRDRAAEAGTGVLPQRHQDTKRTPDRAEFRNQKPECRVADAEGKIRRLLRRRGVSLRRRGGVSHSGRDSSSNSE